MRVIKTIKDIDCIKNIIELDDGYCIEYCFKYPFWICVTTQVGCPIGCKFCYSGKCGFIRNLTVEEMLFQNNEAINISTRNVQIPFKTISFTGMGEPLLNVDNVVMVANYLMDNTNSMISLTTTGNQHGLQKLAFLRRKILLDISVHSLKHEVRKALIPAEGSYDIDSTIKYVLKMNRLFEKVTLDYMLLDGINDNDDDLDMLIKRTKGKNVAVELKCYNNHSQNDVFRQSKYEKYEKFYKKLVDNGIFTTIEE